MDNPPSAQQLTIPDITEGFNGGIGVDFAQKLIDHLRNSRVTTDGGPNQSDITTLQTELETLTNRFDANERKQVQVEIIGITNTIQTVTFQGWGETDYEITYLVAIGSAENPDAGFGIFLIDGTKLANQFQFRCDGVGAGYKLRFFITQYRESGI